MSGKKENMKEIFIDPLTRIEGHIAVHAEVNLKDKRIADAHTVLTAWRGFEVVMQGRKPPDAVWITQRICGVCPVPHATASVENVEMALNAPPPPMGIMLRNFVDMSEELYDVPLGFFILVGPDYSQSIVEKLNPKWFNRAKKSRSESVDVHGYSTIADIMKALNPFSGELWIRSLEMVKLGKTMATLFGAKHPHVNTFVPGGITMEPTVSDLTRFASMLSRHVAFAKEFVALADDLCGFLNDVGYDEAGNRPANLVSYGVYEDTSYDADYGHMQEWGEKRKVTPGIVVNEKLITTDLVKINVGIREYVTHSYYEEWDDREVESDPLGNPIPKEHPWNKKTEGKPGPWKVWDYKYSWDTAPRWHDWMNRVDGKNQVIEGGPIARMWTTAKAKKVPESTGNSLRFTLPKAVVAGYKVPDETTLEWKIPDKVNTIERLRSRAYFYAYSAYSAYNEVLKAMELTKKGEVKVWNRYKPRSDGLGVGLSEAMRGALGHWAIVRNGKIHRYEAITPSTINASPRDAENRPGPYEEALIGTPISETSSSKEIEGVDVVRVVRSFDPCLGCGAHIYMGDRVVFKEILHNH